MKIRLIFGDQLSEAISSLSDLDKDEDVVLMAEVSDEATYVQHHKKKLVLIFSAMRHFAQALAAEGINVDYVKLDDEENTGSLHGELARCLRRHDAEGVVVTEPGEWRLSERIETWPEAMGVSIEVREDTRFLCSRDEFAAWADGRKNLVMEHFYRMMRKRYDILIEPTGSPSGGHWNFDRANRKKLPADLIPPERPRRCADVITKEVIELVERMFPSRFGDIEPFEFAVTRAQAEQSLEFFIEAVLPRFGDYQDAMRADEPFLFHALISTYLNIGLLDPLDVCRRVEASYRDNRAALNAVEGFIRQILGWREFVRGVYWLHMPGYADLNFLGASRSLPDFYWDGETDMNCVSRVVTQTRRHAYAHHIQRLMVTGNFALLSGVEPSQIEDWYLSVYADAFDWVELPNTHGMAIFADGGIMATKPYAASGIYINRMSDYCKACRYDVSEKNGEDACPFNYLYWNFLAENRQALSDNPRVAMPYRNLDRMSAQRQAAIAEDSQRFLAEISR